MLDDLIGMITKHLQKGERVKIAGLGMLVVRNRAARVRPQSGDWGADPDQGQQKGSLPRHQGTQDGDLIAGRARFFAFPLCDHGRHAPRRRNYLQRSHRQDRSAARHL